MKIKNGCKYKVVTDFHHFKTTKLPLSVENSEEGFVLYKDEIYVVYFIFDMQGSCYVNFGVSENQFDETGEKSICIETFKNCFEEIE